MSGPARRPLAERFWPKVEKRGPDECWPWRGARQASGYGRIARPGHSTGVSPFFTHRVAYALAHDLDPETLEGVVRHSCDNPPCCNPAHLLLGDYAANNRDTAARGRAHYQHALRDVLGRFRKRAA